MSFSKITAINDAIFNKMDEFISIFSKTLYAKFEVKKTEKTEFDFANAVVPTIDNDEEAYWTFKKVRIEGEVYRRHAETGLVLELYADVLFGYVSKGAVKVDNIPEKIKKFAKKAGIKLQPVKAVLSDDE